jgi:putative acetyltransferase
MWLSRRGTPQKGRQPYSVSETPLDGKPCTSYCCVTAKQNDPNKMTLTPSKVPKRKKQFMSPKIIIRNETDNDLNAITDVTISAFNTLEISHHTEQFIISALRAANALTLSLVAEVDDLIVGHIAFSPVTVSDGVENWYALGPVSVLPAYQRQGIGKSLVGEGLSRLRNLNAKGCCLVGHPDYYKKFGFRNIAGLSVEGVPREVFFALSFDGNIPQGVVTFHEAFAANGDIQ